MGEGKSSVIIPLVASTLANGSDLVRVVTLKPLSNQMFQLLVSRLSGLANRPIFYVPISRNLRMDTSLVRRIKGLYERCIAERGILVVQPEHILSLKLMNIDTLLGPHRTSNEDESSMADELMLLLLRHESLMADELGQLQDWVSEVSRDILDESDEILHVRYQLIYTAGKQMPINGHPHRWTTIQQVFSRLQAHANQLHANFPNMFAVDARLGGFPIVRILDPRIFHQISSLIINDALEGALSDLPLDAFPPLIQAAAYRFMTQIEVSDEDYELVHSYCAGTTFNGILLLRGLLLDGEGIFGYVLKERRWRVDYGLDPGRTMLAVPYRAKVCYIQVNLVAEGR
jgi:hypothetical protein